MLMSAQESHDVACADAAGGASAARGRVSRRCTVIGCPRFLRPVRAPLRAARKAASRVAPVVVAGAAVLAGTGLVSAAGAGPATAPAARAAAPLPTPVPAVTGPVTGGTHRFPMTASSAGPRSHGYAATGHFFSRTTPT